MLPVETVEALFPSSVAVGKLTLRPMTLAHGALLDIIGIDITAPLLDANVLVAAWVLSLDETETVAVARSADRTPYFRKWCEKYSIGIDEAIEGVNRILVAAMMTFVPPKSANGDSVYATPKGYGWPLELAECLSHEYGMSFDEALDMPLARAYALLNCARQRNGVEAGGVSYCEKPFLEAATQAIRKMREEQEKAKEAEEAKEEGNG